MKKVHLLMAMVMAIIVVIVLGVAYVLRPPAEATAPIEAIPLVVVTAQPESAPPQDTPVSAPTAEPSPAVVEEAAEPTLPAVEETTTAAEPTPAAVAAEPVAAGGVTIYQISQADSQVRFELDEDLRGQRITVVGVTNQVAGQLALNLEDLSQTQVGIIQINARTLTTDNGNRNRAMQNQILQTGSYELITFTPTAVTNLPARANIGETISFAIAGELTIRNISQPVLFTVTATAVSDSQINGTASTVINRGDFNLVIPNVPSVANVEEEVELYIDFVARGS